ncbi:MAG: PBP1A family penicillin-binding protein [Oscillospiraceae bacterium]|nr:PBP1A family penicillin-binding protein [Oscillospiraceae bacterium]
MEHNSSRRAPKKPGAVRAAETVFGTIFKYFTKVMTYALNIVMTLVLIFVITGSIMGTVFALYIKDYIDGSFDIDNLRVDSNLTTSIYFRDIDELGETVWKEDEEERIHGTENRLWVSYNELPKNLINAFVAIEDKRFFTHPGVDLNRMVKAIIGFVTGKDEGGGSTITQQLIKNVTGDDDVRVQRKIQEILRALDLEKRRSKEEIFEMYINTIYLAQGANGVQAAAHVYFNKDVKDLTLVECAALASIPQNPSKWDPVRYPENNKKRRNDQVLWEMYQQGLISQQEFDEAYNAELVLSRGTDDTKTQVAVIHNYFVDAVMDQFIADYTAQYKVSAEIAKQLLFSGGLQIYTTMDKRIQGIMEKVYEDDANFPDTSSAGVKPESAMVIMDQEHGDVVGLVGGRGEKTVARGFNRATQAKRQPGSAIKPLTVYSPALELGLVNYATTFDDTPFRYDTQLKRMWPSNSPAKYEGVINLNYALTNSKNTVAVRIMNMLTPQTAFKFATEKFHMSTFVDSLRMPSGEVKTDMTLSAMALGGLTYGVKVIDMAAAYCTFPNNGVYNKSRLYIKVLDKDGNIILSNEEQPEVILSEETDALMVAMMKNVVANGTAQKLKLQNSVDCAGKTGTTSLRRDLYYVGYTPYYTGAVWYGYDSNLELPSGGESPALYLWDVIMTEIHQPYIDAAKSGGEPLKKFVNSSKIIERYICKDSGKLATENCKLDLRRPQGCRVEKAYFTQATVPTEYCDCHVLVDYCEDWNCVAGPNCKHTHKVALVKTPYREFETQTYVVDAQYTYMELPDGYVYPSDTSLPYYINLYPSDRYPGKTAGVQRPANSFCVEDNYGMTDKFYSANRPPDKGDPNKIPVAPSP